MHRSKHITDTFTLMSRKDYLTGVRARLKNDVVIYFEKLDEEGDAGRAVGFWSSARLIFPVIEAVAKTIYRLPKNKPDNRVPRLLTSLGIKYPEIVWQMWRNSLSHNDHPSHIKFGSRSVSWSITTSAGGASTGHFFSHGVIHLDTRRLLDDFINFLDLEIAVSATNVYVKTGLKVGRKYRGGLVKEIEDLTS